MPYRDQNSNFTLHRGHPFLWSNTIKVVLTLFMIYHSQWRITMLKISYLYEKILPGKYSATCKFPDFSNNFSNCTLFNISPDTYWLLPYGEDVNLIILPSKENQMNLKVWFMRVIKRRDATTSKERYACLAVCMNG